MRHSKPIRSDHPKAFDELQHRIKRLEELQEAMKLANKIVRAKISDEEKVTRLQSECRLEEQNARKLLQPDFAGRIGFASYELTNNAANIRRLRERLDAVGKEQARQSFTFDFPGGRVEDSAEDARVRIYHDAKPGPATIARLKAHGFHWTPSLRCWQRLRSEATRAAVGQIIGFDWPKENQAASNVQAPSARMGI